MIDTGSTFPGRSYDFVDYTIARNWIGGEWRDAESGATIEVTNPRHGRSMGRVVMSAGADVAAAVDKARQAQRGWIDTPIKERVQVLFRLKVAIEKHLDELSWLLSHENGKVYAEAQASLLKAIECIELGTSLPNMATGSQMDVSRGVNCEVTYEPLGVCAGIVPFNFPTMVPMWMIPQALVAGNTFVLKPSEQVPFSMTRIVMLLREAGLPDGVLNLVQGGRDTVEALVDHPDIRAIAFVGSTTVARAVYARGAQTGKRMLCLGGAKNHLVVVPDADPKLTAQNVVASFTGCAGQRCMAASVLLGVGDVQPIIEGIAEEASKLRLGDDMGPIINPQSRERIVRYIDGAEIQGMKVLLDGRQGVEGTSGNWLGATILDQVPVGAPAACDEIFGPVLSIVHTRTLDEAIQIENKSPYGNAASIYTTNGATARYAVERFSAGMCGVNIGVPVPREPFSFGGWNHSKFGHGDITGFDGYRFWTQPKKVTTKWSLQRDQSWMS